LSLSNLPAPTIIEQIDYEAIVQRKLNRVKEILKDKGIEYIPSEADDIMTLIELDAFEEMLLRTSLNERTKQQFLAFATGSNLDHIGITRFGVKRLKGKKPIAQVEFEISLVQDSDIILPKGLLLGDAGENNAILTDEVIIKAGETKAIGTIELNEYVESKDIKCEVILTQMPWVVNVKQLAAFTGGANAESDDRYRERIWISREHKTTAGSVAQYEFYALTADVRVKAVSVKNGGAGVVVVTVLGKDFNTSDDLIDAVNKALNKEEIRPLTDIANVQKAVIKDVAINATLIAKDINLVDFAATKKGFREFEGKFGVKLTIPKIYDLLTDSNIVDVELNTPTSAIACADNEVIRFSFNLHTRGIE